MSLAGQGLYQPACSVFVVPGLRPSFFLLLLFREGPAQAELSVLSPSPASRPRWGLRTIVPVPASTPGESFRPKDIQRVTARLSPWRRCWQTLCPFSASARVALLPPSLQDSHLIGKGRGSKVGAGRGGGGATIRSFVPRTASSSSALENGNTPARESHLKL